MYIEILGKILAGLGLFFVGIKLLSSSMREMSGPKLRQLIAKSTSHPIIASALGVFGGLVMQKPSGVIAILTSMQSCGLITLRQAMPIVAWCNIGLALLAFFVVIPISVFVSYIVGVSGFFMMFSTNKKHVVVVTAIFGAALLFFGLEEMKNGAESLREFEWFRNMVLYSNQSTIVALLVGVAVAAVTQSFLAIALMAVSLVQAGALGEQQAVMIIYGANVGVGFFRRLMTASMTGEAKQLFLYQNFFRYVGTGGSVLLFYVARVDDMPAVLYLAKLATSDVGVQMALIFLSCNLPAVVIASLFQERFALLLERFSPLTPEDELTKLRYLAAADQNSARDMLDKINSELAVRARILVQYCESALSGGTPTVAPEAVHHSTNTALGEIAAFTNRLPKCSLTAEETRRLSVLMNVQPLLRMLDDSLFQMTGIARDGRNKVAEPLQAPIDNLVEAMETLILFLADAMSSGDVIDMAMLENLAMDKHQIMTDIRGKYLDARRTDSEVEKGILLDLTIHYEHCVWIINRLANLIKRGVPEIAPGENQQ